MGFYMLFKTFIFPSEYNNLIIFLFAYFIQNKLPSTLFFSLCLLKIAFLLSFCFVFYVLCLFIFKPAFLQIVLINFSPFSFQRCIPSNKPERFKASLWIFFEVSQHFDKQFIFFLFCIFSFWIYFLYFFFWKDLGPN